MKFMDFGGIRIEDDIVVTENGYENLTHIAKERDELRNLYDEKGVLKQPKDLDEDTAKAVVGVKYDRDGSLLEYKIIDVKGCSELVGKHLKLFPNKHEHSGPDGKPIETVTIDPKEYAKIRERMLKKNDV